MQPLSTITIDDQLVSDKFRPVFAEWGPHREDRTELTRDEARQYCKRLALGHYENFPVVSLILPKNLQRHFFNIYAYCRWSDDLSDEVNDSSASLRLLAWWRNQLDECYRGRAWHPVFKALMETIEECSIPREPFDHLLDAFEQDQRVFRYDTFDQLRDYCRGSADPVGRLILYATNCFNEQNAQWSDSICTGLQLANFWQDVSRDLDIGRVYLPLEDRRRYGYDEDDLNDRVTNNAFLELMAFEVGRAREFLVNGLPLITKLPFRLQIDIELFARGGLRILERIEGIGYRVWDTRPKVTRVDGLRLLGGTVGRAILRTTGLNRSSKN